MAYSGGVNGGMSELSRGFVGAQWYIGGVIRSMVRWRRDGIDWSTG